MKNLEKNDPYYEVRKVYKQVSGFLPTITANQYDYYKLDKMPVSKTIMNRTGKKWHEVLDYLGLPTPLSRNTLARLSDSLHYLEKLIKKKLNVGWEERSFRVQGKTLRPDSCFVERFLVNDNRFFILDVKLCLSATPITIYKYLPLFENNELLKEKSQLTFFEEWLPLEATQRPLIHYDNEGQTNMALENNVLYMCYLIGRPKTDAIPCSVIRGKVSSKKKTLPSNMEVRYVSFFDLPELYCRLAGIGYKEETVKVYLEWAFKIKSLIQELPDEVESLCRDISKNIHDMVDH